MSSIAFRPTAAMIRWMERNARYGFDDRPLNDAARLSDSWTYNGGLTAKQYNELADHVERDRVENERIARGLEN